MRLPITRRVEGAPYPPTPETLLTAFRAAQEAFTHISKRAVQRTGALVLLTWASRSPGVPVAAGGDGGRGAELVSGGYGLAGRERGALYGGQREAGPSEDGLTVRLRLPIDLDPRAEPS
jgi:signal transduction histidine kinase